MLKTANLTKEFKNVIAVNNISFQIDKGKIFGILGPNGSGKTTIIRIILDILKPDSGTVTYQDKIISEKVKNKIGYLPEERGLYKKSKVKDIVYYFAGLKNLSKPEIETNFNYWSQKLYLEEHKNRKLEELSKGNQQKVQLLAALIHNPEILIMDEPFAGFDPVNQKLVRQIISEYVSPHKIVLLSTHLLNLADDLCNEVLLLNNGKEVLHGSLFEIKQNFNEKLYRLEIELSKNELENYGEIVSINELSGEFEIELKNDVVPSNFLAKISNQYKVDKFVKIKPSLYQIFIHSIENHNL